MSWDAADLDTHYPRHLIDDVAAQAMLARPMSTIRIGNYIGATVVDQVVAPRAEEALDA